MSNKLHFFGSLSFILSFIKFLAFRARGFNCSVTCEGFDFSQLFARIPFSENEEEDDEEEYDDDEDEYEEEDDYYDQEE